MPSFWASLLVEDPGSSLPLCIYIAPNGAVGQASVFGLSEGITLEPQGVHRGVFCMGMWLPIACEHVSHALHYALKTPIKARTTLAWLVLG